MFKKKNILVFLPLFIFLASVVLYFCANKVETIYNINYMDYKNEAGTKIIKIEDHISDTKNKPSLEKIDVLIEDRKRFYEMYSTEPYPKENDTWLKKALELKLALEKGKSWFASLKIKKLTGDFKNEIKYIEDTFYDGDFNKNYPNADLK